MSGWIPVDKDLTDDPRLLDVAMAVAERYTLARHGPGEGHRDLEGSERLRLVCYAVTGALVTLWRYADQHLQDDNTLPMSLKALDAFIGLEGFIDALPEDWIVERDDGRVMLPGYCEKNGLIAKRKRTAKAKNRMAAYRARLKSDAQHIHNVPRNERDSSTASSATRSREHFGLDQDQDLRPRPKDKTERGGEEKPPVFPTRAVKKKNSSTATRIPEAFALTPERAAYAVGENLDPSRTFAKFTDHWRSASGAKARKHDWDATWRNWCRNETDFRVPRGTNGSAAEPVLTWRPDPEPEPTALQILERKHATR